jgi:hypothetical protein
MCVAHVPGTRLRILAFLILGAGASAACAAVTCTQSASSNEEMLTIMHIEGSDGPTTWTLTVHVDGVLKLAKLGKKPRCKQVPGRELQHLIGLVENEAFRNVGEFDGYLGHQEWMQVVHQGSPRRFIAEDLPPEVLSMFEEVDRLFAKEFGHLYSWPLISSASGP